MATIIYTRALEELDRKAGRVHTTDDWHRIGEKSQRDPASITDDDLIVLEGFGGPESAAAARTRRALALNPPPPLPRERAKRAARTPLRRITHEIVSVHDQSTERHVKFKGLDPYARMLFKDLIEPLLLFQLGEVVTAFTKADPAKRTRITELEQLVKSQADELSALRGQLETWTSKALTDGGIWKSDGTLYQAGQVVTRDGSAWVCTRTHAQLGPFDHTCWRLLVKRGRDGKDAADIR